MMIIISYRVPGSFGSDREKDHKIIELAKSLEGKFVGSGSGCGRRDLEFEFVDLIKAEEFMQRCRQLGLDVSEVD